MGNGGGDEPDFTDPDFVQFCQYVGVSGADDPLVWVAKDAYVAPLPPNWAEFCDEQGRIYFFNYVTNKVKEIARDE